MNGEVAKIKRRERIIKVTKRGGRWEEEKEGRERKSRRTCRSVDDRGEHLRIYAETRAEKESFGESDLVDSCYQAERNSQIGEERRRVVQLESRKSLEKKD